MEDFVRSQGVSFLAHLLRRVSDELVQGSSEWHPEAGLLAPPRTVSTVQALHQRGEMSVTELAKLLRQSHPLVISWIRQLKSLNLVQARADRADKRRTLVRLTDEGVAEAERQLEARKTMERAIRNLLEEADADLFDSMWRVHEACQRQSFAERLRNQH